LVYEIVKVGLTEMNRAKKQKREWPFDDRFEVKLEREAS
jgi:hypothetical protein